MATHKMAKKERSEESRRASAPNTRTCTTCNRDISSEICVKCTRCPGFDQCLECFSVGSESQYHIRSHPFILLDPVLPPIFQRGWSSEQEILLLNAIQVCGLGNWHEIADIVQTKSALECESHYFSTYVDADTAPIPGDTILDEPPLPKPPPFDTTPRESRPSIAHERNLLELHKKERTTPAELSGWMPRRSEFEVEYLNDAEQIISGIQFSDAEDSPTTLEQKLSSLRAYNEKVTERQFRSDFAKDWDLLDHEFRSFGGRSRGEREMEESLMPLAQVVPRDVLTRLILSLQAEMRLKDKIETYKKWRRNGIVTHDEGLLFNQLEELLAEDKLSTSAVEKWNRDVMVYAESPEFRATFDRQLLSSPENKLCQNFGISPHSFLRVKDLLLREYTARGQMTREIAVSFMPSQEQVMVAIYECLKMSGMFFGVDDIDNVPV